MFENPEKLISKYFDKSIIIYDAEKFKNYISSLERKTQKRIKVSEIENIFEKINLYLPFFKKNFSLNGLTLNNLYKYMYDAIHNEGKSISGSKNRQNITLRLHKLIYQNPNDFTPIEDLFREEKVNFPRKQIEALIGLAKVKEEINELAALANIQKLKLDKSILTKSPNLNLCFTGNPGTGKTTVARLLGAIYAELGLISSGHLIEASRGDIVEKYIGHTAKNVKELFEKAKGGVLFIDEAYSLSRFNSDKDFGKEAIDTIVQLTELYKDDLVLILAGYPSEMEEFMNSNPGLKSRIPKSIMFEDYTSFELIQIFDKMINDIDHKLSNGAKYKLELIIEKSLENGKNNGNARDIRNLVELSLKNQAKRLSELSQPTFDQLRTIEPNDLPELTD